jgi:hypothetical protein
METNKGLSYNLGSVDITLTVMRKIQTIGSKQCSTIQQLPLQTTILTKYWEEEIINDNLA